MYVVSKQIYKKYGLKTTNEQTFVSNISEYKSGGPREKTGKFVSLPKLSEQRRTTSTGV